MEKIGIIFDIKNNKYGPPTRYLGADVKNSQLPYVKVDCILTSNSYVKVSFDTVKNLLLKYRIEIKNGKSPYKLPLPYGYNPDIDVTYKCD